MLTQIMAGLPGRRETDGKTENSRREEDDTMQKLFIPMCFILALFISENTLSADVVPTDIQQPGTQPLEISNLESPDKCDNCHGGYNSAVEPAHNWRGSMMALAGRDPIFWATVAVAEQNFDGVGDLCIRCHSTGGWLAGRSTPTDGSGLAAGDSDGVECDYCHKLTNPNDLEHQGVMNVPFIANYEAEGYYGSGMSSMWGGGDKLGPYIDAEARHKFMQSEFHRDADFCGTCHDVSNSAVGDLAPNHGVLFNTDPLTASGVPDSPVDGKAAFNNPPYRYGVVERTFSEYKSGAISSTRVDDYPALPDDLKGGVLEAIYLAASNNGAQSANYQNPPATRYFTCQTCHMRPVTGTGANKRGVPVRTDLPLHDMTGGNYWMATAIEYLDGLGKLRLGGGMTGLQISAMHDGALRAEEQLRLAASLEVEGNEVKIINHTGHKLISGYPEGRRMWLNIKWYDGVGALLREDGAYGEIGITMNGVKVRSIKDLEDPNLFIYEAHMGMTGDWASSLLGLGFDSGLALSYNRMTGGVEYTLGDLAGMSPDSSLETFHFALNNTVIKDNRIPPYGMSYNEAERRNASPVPQDQYDGRPGGVYDYYDEHSLSPPGGAKSATVDLLYQPTSWEYIRFLDLANKGRSSFLGDEGNNMLDAWLNAGRTDNTCVTGNPYPCMAEPLVMATASWHDSAAQCEVEAPTLVNAHAADKEVALAWAALPDGNVVSYSLYYDQSGKAQRVADLVCASTDCTSYTDSNLTNGQAYCYKVTASSSECESGFSNIMCATPLPPGQESTAGILSLQSGKWVREGKGKHATETFVFTTDFAAGDEIVFRMVVTDQGGAALPGATVNLAISGPENTSISSNVSDAIGNAEALWTTQRPNKKGDGGTASGGYKATVSGLNAPSNDWDGQAVEVDFTIGVSAVMRMHH
jgi:hypothetical protein